MTAPPPLFIAGAFWRAGFEWATHAPFALEAGVSAAAVEAVRRGEPPAFAREDEAAVHAFALELQRDRRVSDATYARAAAALGTPGVVDLVGVLGYYTLISMTINAFEAPPPAGAPDPFA